MSVHRTRLKNLCITCCRCCCQSLSEALSIPPIPIHTDSSCLICVFRSVAGNLVAGAGWVNLCWVAHTKVKAMWLESSDLAASQLVLNHSLWSVLEPLPFTAS